jgi:hypothetical protein
VAVPKGTSPTRVTLFLDDLAITSTYAVAQGGAVEGGARTKGKRSGAAAGAAGNPKKHLPGPGRGRRNARQEVRWFLFRLDDVWRFAGRSTRVSVRADGAPLPITGHGMFLKPRSRAEQTVDDLRGLMAKDLVFSHKGKLQLSKQRDLEWQGRVMRLFERTNAVLQQEHGYDAFFVYGTLLGAVREGNYIGHDMDFDSAFVSSESDPTRVGEELVEVASSLIQDGLNVVALPTHLHVSDPAEPGLHIDLFHTYFDADGVLSFPFGVAGSRVVRRDDWGGVRDIDWPFGPGRVPDNAQQLVECLYGADWRQPKPGFHWPRDRVGAAEGRLTEAQRSKVYWTNFYARTSYSSGSTFFEFVNARPDTPGTVIDIGCGDGRDSCAFGAAGRRVLGLDQSPIGVQHAAARASTLALDDSVDFQVCDVADTQSLTRLLRTITSEAADAPVLFYLRFFLHSITEEVQDGLMDVISGCARPGDLLAAEFRTEKDELATKVHGKHYRRYQNGQAFGASLTERHSFALLHEEESTGLSPYKGEDPVLYRVVARRNP